MPIMRKSLPPNPAHAEHWNTSYYASQSQSLIVILTFQGRVEFWELFFNVVEELEDKVKFVRAKNLNQTNEHPGSTK